MTCNTLPIDKLHEFQLIRLVHKTIYCPQHTPDIFQTYFPNISEKTHYNLRQTHNLQVQRYNKCIGQRSCQYRCVHLWNKLTRDIKLTASQPAFGKKLKIILQ